MKKRKKYKKVRFDYFDYFQFSFLIFIKFQIVIQILNFHKTLFIDVVKIFSKLFSYLYNAIK